ASAIDLRPLPSGEYIAQLIEGKFYTASTGTPGYELTFQVLEGEYARRRLWHKVWFTERAMPIAKRDLGKLGVKDLEQLDRPLPEGIRFRLTVVLHREDDGREHNRVRSFEVIGQDEPDRDPFAPKEDNTAAGDPGSSAATAEGRTQG